MLNNKYGGDVRDDLSNVVKSDEADKIPDVNGQRNVTNDVKATASYIPDVHGNRPIEASPT